MFISPVNFNQINFKTRLQIPFKGSAKNIYSTQPAADEFIKSSPVLKRGQILDDGEIYTCGATEFFRFDIDWNQFSEYLKERFKNYDKINTYDYACSDGSESYSLSIMLQHKFKDQAEKFFPIYAKDLDEDKIAKNIQNQKTGEMELKKSIAGMANAINMDANEMGQKFIITKKDSSSRPFKKAAILKEKVTKPIIFSEANILDDIKNIDSKNPSIIMCRNMWPYVDTSEYPEFAKNLYEKLANDSIVVLGAFDCFFDKTEGHDSENISKALLNAGFEESKCKINDKYNLIFEKN